MIQAGSVFKDNLAQLPGIDTIARIDLLDDNKAIVASIPNEPGKKGSLAVYQYLQQEFPMLNTTAARHGLAIFAEHTLDARLRPGAHPNIDRLIDIVEGAAALHIQVVATA